ncbi:hypothetical protein LQT46_24590 (plasmid) [Escherichia coli]|nr:hypothetical protein LQT46_24590 [Escherichia coli]
MITSFANPEWRRRLLITWRHRVLSSRFQQHNQSDVWLADESPGRTRAAELARFLENPADPRYLAASWQSGHTDSGLHYRRYPSLPPCVNAQVR